MIRYDFLMHFTTSVRQCDTYDFLEI